MAASLTTLEFPTELLEQKLADATSMNDGLETLKSYLKPHGVRDLIYIFMLHPKSYIRNDFVYISTFPEEIGELYRQHGGAASYSFGDIMPVLKQPIFFDIQSVRNQESPLFSYNKCTEEILKQGYNTCWIVPVLMGAQYGYGALMLFEDNRLGRPKMDHQKLLSYGKFYHACMKNNMQMAAEFELTMKQRQTLASISRGNTAADIAMETGLVERTIEQRLHQVRKKLRARTTTEAVYKALIYGLIPIIGE